MICKGKPAELSLLWEWQESGGSFVAEPDLDSCWLPIGSVLIYLLSENR